jgi:hypothetical protein
MSAIRARSLPIAILCILVIGCSDPASVISTPGAAPSPPDASSSADARAPTTDAGAREAASDASVAGNDAGAAEPSCGDPPSRYTLLSGADDGLARDNVTRLVWMRESHGAGEPPQTQAPAASYCASRTMRLPTKSEAADLADHYAPCAFGHWGTWTSTAAAADGYAWIVDYTGGASPQVANNFPSAVLCVRDLP